MWSPHHHWGIPAQQPKLPGRADCHLVPPRCLHSALQLLVADALSLLADTVSQPCSGSQLVSLFIPLLLFALQRSEASVFPKLASSLMWFIGHIPHMTGGWSDYYMLSITHILTEMHIQVQGGAPSSYLVVFVYKRP